MNRRPRVKNTGIPLQGKISSVSSEVATFSNVIWHPDAERVRNNENGTPTFSFSYRFIWSAFIWRQHRSENYWNSGELRDTSQTGSTVHPPALSASVLSQSAPSFSFWCHPAAGRTSTSVTKRHQERTPALKQRGSSTALSLDRRVTGERLVHSKTLWAGWEQKMCEDGDQALWEGGKD